MTETDRSDTETRTSSAGKTQRCFLREHLVHGSDPEHLTFILRHRTHLASVVSLGFDSWHFEPLTPSGISWLSLCSSQASRSVEPRDNIKNDVTASVFELRNQRRGLRGKCKRQKIRSGWPSDIFLSNHDDKKVGPIKLRVCVSYLA